MDMALSDDFIILPNKEIHVTVTLAPSFDVDALYSYLVYEWGFVERHIFANSEWVEVGPFASERADVA